MDNYFNRNKVWAGMLFLAILPMPSEYYWLLRVAICGISIYYLLDKKEDYKDFAKWAFVFMIIIFNPIFPFYFGKLKWAVIDAVCGLFFLWLNTPYSRRWFK